MNFDLRPAQDTDLVPLLGRLMPEYYAHDQLEFSREELEPVLRQFIRDPELGRIWMIETEADGLIGYLALSFCFSLEASGRVAYIDEFFLLPDFRGQGLGAEILRLVIHLCPDLGVRLLRLEVTAHNERVKALYRRSGFRDSGRSVLTLRL